MPKKIIFSMIRKPGILIILTLLVGQICFAQKNVRSKELKVQGIYTHTPTMTKFPETIRELRRQSVNSFDKQKNNIGITYQSDKGKTTLSIFIYPAGEGYDGRLRSEYINGLQDIADAKNDEVRASQYSKDFKNGIYKINGYSAFITGDTKSLLTVFECGLWFFKVRITTELLDTAGINSLEREILRTLDPTRIAKNNPLNVTGRILIAPAAFRDSLMLTSVLGGGLQKSAWARQNIDSTERIAGFPDLYLAMHVKSWLTFNEFQKTSTYKSIHPDTKTYLSQWEKIINAGFLEEFIMEQYNMVMIVPENMVLDFDSFYKWRIDNPIKIDLSEKWYSISYPEKK